MCSCERHNDITKVCTCKCSHPSLARLKRYIYKHAHKCSLQNEFFAYRPATQGPVMFPIHPVCVEAEAQLMLVRIEDDE